MTETRKYSIANQYKSKVLEALDKWDKRGLSQSEMICKSIIKQHAEEEKANKLPNYFGNQTKLPLLPPVYEVPKMSDLDGLTYDELRTVMFAAMEMVALTRKRIEITQKQR